MARTNFAVGGRQWAVGRRARLLVIGYFSLFVLMNAGALTAQEQQPAPQIYWGDEVPAGWNGDGPESRDGFVGWHLLDDALSELEANEHQPYIQSSKRVAPSKKRLAADTRTGLDLRHQPALTQFSPVSDAPNLIDLGKLGRYFSVIAVRMIAV